MFYTNYVILALQTITGLALLLSAVALFLATIAVHPERKRSDLLPLAFLSASTEFSVALVLLVINTTVENRILYVVLYIFAMMSAVCLTFIRFYYLNLVRSLFTKTRETDARSNR